MQRTINSANIETFGFSVTFNLVDRMIVFDISELTEFVSGGNINVQGINFSVTDQAGIELLTYDWDDPQIPLPSTDASPIYAGESTYELDLGFYAYNFLFQQYQIKGAIKEANGTIYELEFPIKSVTMPNDFTDEGTVEGSFDLKADCNNSILTVKETTVFAYKGKEPYSETTTGILYYPLGTISSIAFTFTPFQNNVIYTGTYKIDSTTVVSYDLSDDFYVEVSYTTVEQFEITCEKHMASIACCISDALYMSKKHCGDPIGNRIDLQLDEVRDWIILGLLKENSGQDASEEAANIKKVLKCSCGKGSIKKVSPTPINTAFRSIVINAGTGIGVSTSTAGQTTQYTISAT